jgi:hypothetical protein
MSFFIIEDSDVVRLEAVATRLFSEERMHGDAMRDMAQLIAMVTRRVREIPMVEEATSAQAVSGSCSVMGVSGVHYAHPQCKITQWIAEGQPSFGSMQVRCTCPQSRDV